MSFSLLPADVIHLVLDHLDGATVIAIRTVSTDLVLLVQAHMTTKLADYLGYVPSELVRSFLLHRSVGRPCVYDCMRKRRVDLPVLTNIRKIVMGSDGYWHCIDIHDNWLYIRDQHVVRDTSCKTYDICSGGHWGVLRLTDHGVKVSRDIVATDTNQWKQLVTDAGRSGIYYLTKGRSLRRRTCTDVLVIEGVRNCHEQGYTIYCITDNGLFAINTLNGSEPHTQFHIDQAVEKFMVLGDRVVCLVSNQEETTDGGLYLSTKHVKDFCSYGDVPIVLYHDGRLVCEDTIIDTDVISISGDVNPPYLAYIRSPK
jgi:hypothetical protein